MKRIVLSLAAVAMVSGAAFAQEKKPVISTLNTNPTPAPTAEVAKPTTTLTADNISFSADSYDFGSVEEGPAAEHVFQFTNTGKEPLIIQRVQPSCGCTTPDWTKEAIDPGKTGMIKASYGTQGRPGHFEKSLTVFSNAGTKMLTFKGTVEKAPETSVPQNTSMMRTN